MVSAIDITIVIVYLLIMLGVGYLSGKNNKTQDDYFLAGHSMPWIPVALSVAATMGLLEALAGHIHLEWLR